MANTKAATETKPGGAKSAKRRESNGTAARNPRNGGSSPPKPERVRLPVLEPAAARPVPSAIRGRNRAPGGDLHLRFKFASLLRLSDNLVRKAVTVYDRLFLLEEGDQAEIYLELGRQLVRDGKPQDAIEAFRKASSVKPEQSAPLVELGLLHASRGALEAAAQAFQKAKGLGQPSYKLHMSLADVLTQQAKYEEAVEELENALRLRKDIAEIPYRLGVALSRTGRCEEAIDAFELAIEIAPQEVAYHQSLGFALESVSRRPEAVECFKRALELEHAAGIEAE